MDDSGLFVSYEIIGDSMYLTASLRYTINSADHLLSLDAPPRYICEVSVSSEVVLCRSNTFPFQKCFLTDQLL